MSRIRPRTIMVVTAIVVAILVMPPVYGDLSPRYFAFACITA